MHDKDRAVRTPCLHVLLALKSFPGIALVWEGMLFVDTIILGLTVYKVYQLRKSSSRDLLKMLLRDGE